MRKKSLIAIILIVILSPPADFSMEGREIYIKGQIYFPGDTIEIESSFMPEDAYILTPIGMEKIEFKKKAGAYLAEFPLKKNVILGNYTIFVDGISREVYVDSYSIEAEVINNTIHGKVKYYTAMPGNVSYTIMPANLTGEAEVKDGKFTIPLPPEGSSCILKLGNARLNISLQLEKPEHNRKLKAGEIYFPGEVVEIRANFKPEVALISDPLNRTAELSFEEQNKTYAALFNLSREVILGEYVISADGIVKRFVVDFYEINASFNGSSILGYVDYYFIEPEKIYWRIADLEGYSRVINGSFAIAIDLPPGNYSAFLSSGNAELELNFTVVTVVKKLKRERIVAYDPVERTIITKFEEFQDVKGELKEKHHKIPKIQEMRYPASKRNLKKFGFPEEILNTTLTVKRIKDDKLRVELNSKLEVWYRFRVEIPPGYRVREIVGDDGRRIVNSLSVNRSTGEVTGEIRWYMDNSTLYFYDDPIWGYDITLTPPAPNNSTAIELAYSGTTSGAGQISAVVFPYSQGDDATTIATYDHAGRTEDNGYGNDIDIDAGSKIALRYRYLLGFLRERQYGNPYGGGALGDDYITHLNREDVPLNTVPDGTLESVIITDMETPLFQQTQLNITQKVIIRDNNRWFATVYYVKNIGSRDLQDLRFFQGMDWNFRGSYTGDNGYYNSTYDIVYGYDSNAPPGDIQYGGYSSDLGSSVHDVDWYYWIWTKIAGDSLANGSTYTGDAATALAWDIPSLNIGDTLVIPIIWGLGYNLSDMVEQITAGKAMLYDTGIKSIDYPANNSKFNPNTVQVIYFNATAALYGLVDAENLNITFNITRIGGGYSYENYTSVNLSVPFNETAQVSFPLNISGMPYGSYNVTFRTNLANDQNSSNDLKWIVIHLIAFTVEPDQEKTANAGEEVFYNLTAGNYYSAGRFDVNITRSTKAWTSRVYNASVVAAEDTDGDGAWDYIAPGYDSNANGLPDIYLPYGESNITVSKVISSGAPLGEVDYTMLNFVSVSDPSVGDDVTLTTSTPLPPSQPKTFYLHGNLVLNTSRDTSTANYTAIPLSNLQSWYQSPSFADDFTISGKIRVSLWLNSSSATALHTVTVSLLYTDGTTSTVLGTNTSRFAPGGTPALQTFEITLDSATTILRNNYLILRVENSQTGQTLYVHHDASYNSNVTLNTTTYVKVYEISRDKTSYKPGETAILLANITDPIGSYDIAGANITIYYPNSTLYIQDAMTLNSTDPGVPSLWKLFNYSFLLPVEGVYSIVVEGIESNGVTANLSYNLSAFIRIYGRVFEDLGSLGRAFNPSEDRGISKVNLTIFIDDGDGIFNPSQDPAYATTTTNSSGDYNFSVGRGIYFIGVNSKTINTTRGLNSGYTMDDIWAEQSFQVEWNGSAHAGAEKFGGRNASVSDLFGLILFDDFESWEGWQNYRNGVVEQSSVVSYKGSYSLRKTGFNDPNGGYKLIGTAVDRDTVLEGYTYRPRPWGGGAIDRIGIEDSSFNGYSFRVHHSQNYISIDRRTGGAATEISTRVAWDPPENGWYYWRLFLYANGTVTFSTYYVNGTPAASVSASDSTYSTFDRLVVHGGYDYYVDNLYLRSLNADYEHLARVNTSAYASESLDFGFSFDLVVNNRDADDDAGARYAQGALRQFIQNSNAIAGRQRSYFVMMTTPNSRDASGSWWTIALNSSLGELPVIAEETELNGTVLTREMGVNDTNPGYVLYSYSAGALQSYSTRQELPVGTGSDAVPFSGDEVRIKAVPKPELEIYGNGILGSVLNVSAGSSIISDISIFGAGTNYSASGWWNYGIGIKAGMAETSYGMNIQIKEAMVGLRANGSDPMESGMNRNEYAGIAVYSNNASILDSAVAYNGATGVFFWGDYVDYALVKNVMAVKNGRIRSAGDGFGVEGYASGSYDQRASNVTFENCLASKNAGFGIDSWFGKEGIGILNCTLEQNGAGNETGEAVEQGGIRALANSSLIMYNLIRDNVGPGVVVGRMANFSTSGVKMTKNSIHNNSGTGIDIDPQLNDGGSYSGDNVTLNDGLLNLSQPNSGIDYPVITHAYLNGSLLYIEGFTGNESGGASSAFGGAEVEVYMVKNSSDGDDLRGNNHSATGELSNHYGEGWLYLGTLAADAAGRFNDSIDIAGKGVVGRAVLTATATLAGEGTSEFGKNYQLGLYLRNISASITLLGLNATINVTAYGKAQHGVYVYWLRPENISIASMSGDYTYSAVSGNVYRWSFEVIKPGETKQLFLNLSATGSYSLTRAYMIGVDPE